jgi:hypothetical protein
MRRFFKKRVTKGIAVFLLLNMLSQLFAPGAAYALTGGPSQPEVQSFEPVGTSEMVDLFSGDYNYNIPLIDVGGYLVNISYHSGIGMDQEASMVGLGWNINPGVINRSMRGLPDDFKGEQLVKDFFIKDNETYGLTVSAGAQLFGIDPKMLSLSYSLGLSYNNYKGWGFEMSANLAHNAQKEAKGPFTASLGLSAGSESGVGIQPNAGFRTGIGLIENLSASLTGSIGLSFNSREGLKALTFGLSPSISYSRSFQRNAEESQSTSKNNQPENKVGDHEEKTYTAGGGIGYSTGSALTFTSPVYSPQIGMPLKNISASFSATIGTEIFGIHPNLGTTGYYSKQYLATTTTSHSSYGYLYSEDFQADETNNSLADLNREKDGPFTENSVSLPLTNFSYDIYSVAGQGIAGMYRPYRNDVGVLYDNKVSTTAASFDLGGLEIGPGNGVHMGIDFKESTTNSTSGKWASQNGPLEVLGFKGASSSDPFFEPYYFKQVGEKNLDPDPGFLASIGGFAPVRVEINENTDDFAAQKLFVDASNNSIPITRDKRNKRQPRNQSITLLTAGDARKAGIIKSINSYPENTFSINSQTGTYSGSPVSWWYPSHHISEVTVLRPDGARYVFGIPAYNKHQEEVTFAVNDNLQNGETIVNNSSDKDRKENGQGRDEFYSKTTTPAYAHSYLLTCVLSADYVDKTGDGPTSDDLGTYTKINYTKAHDTYKWRTPYGSGAANFNEGFRSDLLDNKASYVYGQKEVWYIHSIESKTQVAEFIVSDREDSKGVQDKDGAMNTGSSLKKLDQIRLFSKPDRIENGSQATPIKVVNFEYDYSLCPNVPNNPGTAVTFRGSNINANKGKLTLKKIYFTYGFSNKGRLNAYEFHYADSNHDGIMEADLNPSYDIRGYDRWGNYKPVRSNPTNSEAPYVDQRNRAQADKNMAAWSLSTIDLPSGGTIKIDYEADDYAFVQNKTAMEMVQVAGAGNTPSPTSMSSNNVLYVPGAQYQYLYFRLDKPLPAGTPHSEIRRSYFTDENGHFIDHLGFRFLMTIDNTSKKEFVPGYAKINDDGGGGCGIVPPIASATQCEYGWVRLQLDDIADLASSTKVNPISQATWNFTKLYRPKVAYNQDDVNANGIVQILKAIYSTFLQIKQMFTGFCSDLKSKNYGSTFDPNMSWIRLYNPERAKVGGGSRVKKLAISDRWREITGRNNYSTYEYGQEYDYTIEKNGSRYSSGVAAYEPLIGNEENPWRQPVYYKEKHRLVPDETFMKEEPFGESFFPAASVGYSQVTVRTVPLDANGVPVAGIRRNASGYVVHKFWTSREFPVFTYRTPVKAAHNNNIGDRILRLLKIKNRDLMTASQGFSIELNDMHGKPRGQAVYAGDNSMPGSGNYKPLPEHAEAISSVEYFYKAIPKSKDAFQLDNTVSVINKYSSPNRIEQRNVGVEYDFVLDMRQEEAETFGFGIQGNLDVFIVGIFPIPVPIILPSFNSDYNRFRSAVTTKVINRFGLLDSTVAKDLGSRVVTKNKLYDSETGEVLLTETINQHDDPVFAFTYPAHWGYDRMGLAYKNAGLNLQNHSITSLSSAYFIKGDELLLEKNGTVSYGWVYEEKATGLLKVIDRNGITMSGTYDRVKIIRSGRRNQQMTPMGKTVTLNNPLVDSNGDGKPDMLQFSRVLDASASEFTDKGALFCDCDKNMNDVFNPFIEGTEGVWRPKKSHLYLTPRIQTVANKNVNLRRDGIFRSFNPFWIPVVNNTGDWMRDTTNWTWTSEVTTYSPYGPELENRDALKRYSAATYGYGNMLPTSVSSNSRYRDVGVDNFEDYGFPGCINDHFSFRNYFNNLSRDAHSGKKSIKVGPQSNIYIKRVIDQCNNPNNPNLPGNAY